MASEDLKQLTYDFDFICQAFNLVPWREGAFNAGAIVNILFDEDGNSVVSFFNGESITLSPADLVELETLIKKRIAEAQIIARLPQPGIIMNPPTVGDTAVSVALGDCLSISSFQGQRNLALFVLLYIDNLWSEYSP